MKRDLIILWVALCVALCPAASSAAPPVGCLTELEGTQTPVPRVYRFINGLWFDGQGFQPKTVYSVDGRFAMKYQGAVDQTLDLQGKYVIPPFGEAHTHHFMVGMDYQAQMLTYLVQGIFYAKNPNSLSKLTDPIRAAFNKPTSIDVIYANGGLTGSGGHPIQIYDFLTERKALPGLTKEQMPGQAYFVIDSEADLKAQWQAIKAAKPDFIKVYLEFSEEYEARKDDAKYFGQKGLNPKLLPQIVRFAHRDGLRVSAHINTAMDFHNALQAGVDEITHLPLAKIGEADARLAARNRITVVTTTLSHRKSDHVTGLAEIHRENLRLLHRLGIKLALGTDDNGKTVLSEAENLHKLGVFDSLTLLKMWTETTAQAIFPRRKIGYLKEGYEASFLALTANPLEDFLNVKKIVLRFKQGQVIEVPNDARLRL